MRKFSKKLLSLLLVVAMIVPMCGMMFTVGAEDKSSIKVGDTITLGKYLGESIVWRCVAIDKNGPLMLSDKLLCFKSFDAKGNYGNYYRNKEGTNNWKDSALRHWLNSSGTVDWSNRISVPSSDKVFNGYNPYSDEKGFLTGFTTQELSMVKSVIQKTYINALDKDRADGGNTAITHYDGSLSNLANVTSNLSNCYYQNVQDSFFLLGIEQLETVYKNMGIEYFKCQPTDAAVKNDTTGFTNTDTTYNWWLRIPATMGMSYENVKVVGIDGGYGGLSAFSVWNGSNYYSVGVRPAFYLDLDKYEESVKKTPSGYDFFKDSYNFGNPEEKISVEYFKTMYEDSSGKALYKKKKNISKDGLCFGMAYTTASIYNGLPSVNRFSGVSLNPKNIRDLKKSHKFSVGDYEITLEDFIKYAFIYQWSSDLYYRKYTYNSPTDTYKLVNLTKEYVKNDQIGICLELHHCEKNKEGKLEPESGHAVLVVGIDGNDILVDDPNSTKELQRLSVNDDGSWKYSLPWCKDGVSSDNSYLFYSVSYFRPYQMLKTGTTTTVRDGVLSDNSSDTASETYVDDMQRLDSDHTLITMTGSVEITGTDIVAPISSTNLSASFSDATNNGDIIGYWVEDSNEITIENTSGGENDIQYAKDNLLVSTESTNFSSITVADNTVLMNTTKNSKVSLTIETVYTYEDFGTTINGIASGEQVTVSKTKDGYTVIGLKDMKITHLKNDEEVDHTDVDHDGICDICSTNLTANCTCSCHSNAFIKLIYKIIAFILSLFGNNFDCACGMSHR